MFKEGLLIFIVGMAGTNLFLWMMVWVMRALEKPLARMSHLLPERKTP